MRKQLMAWLLVMLLLLAGCGSAGESTGGSQPQTPAPPEQPGKTETVLAPEDESLKELREKAAGALCAVAYLGYSDAAGYADIMAYLKDGGFEEVYPFLTDLPEEHTVLAEGGELYLLVPTTAETEIVVRELLMDDSDDYIPDPGEELLRISDGSPLLLRGNVSEIVPNLLVTVKTADGKTTEYSPCLSMMDGSLSRGDGIYDCTDYESLLFPGGEFVDEVPAFCGVWYTQTADGDGLTRAMKLSLWYDGTAEYSYGIPESSVLESFAGHWSEGYGVLTLELHGGPAGYEGEDAAAFAYDSVCSFAWDYQSRHLTLAHTGGDVLLYGTEGGAFDFLPFDSYLLAGTWTADAPVRDWSYDLSLLENGECLFRISEDGRELALYEGWWFMTEEFYVSLDLGLNSGQHPENPEMTFFSGTYLAERTGNTMDLTFASGGILTLGMEEHGWDAFVLSSNDSCVSVHYAADLGIAWDEYDWVIVDDTVPVEAVFCTMVPVENFTVVSLFWQGDGSFEATELYDYGTLSPETPLCVVLTDYGSIPSYGISFTDLAGAERLFGVTVSGMDGSLVLTELL